jgi:riboflavin biosynthesis pyrimidine reductase
VGNQLHASKAFNDLVAVVARDYRKRKAAAEAKEQRQEKDKQQQDQSVPVAPMAAAAQAALRELLEGLGEEFGGYLDVLVEQKFTVGVLGSGAVDAGTLWTTVKVPAGDAVQIVQAARAVVANQAGA